MNEPLALLLCHRGVVAAQLVQRLETLHYRLASVPAPTDLTLAAEGQRAMVAFVDVDGLNESVLSAIRRLRTSSGTAHIPVIAFAQELDDAMLARVLDSGATCAVVETAVLEHLSHLLNRVLELP
jgi:CheY-like chemotaxis protein